MTQLWITCQTERITVFHLVMIFHLTLVLLLSCCVLWCWNVTLQESIRTRRNCEWVFFFVVVVFELWSQNVIILQKLFFFFLGQNSSIWRSIVTRTTMVFLLMMQWDGGGIWLALTSLAKRSLLLCCYSSFGCFAKAQTSWLFEGRGRRKKSVMFC